MVLGAHEQPSTLLVHQQSVIAAGPLQPEGPEPMPGLELCQRWGPLRGHCSLSGSFPQPLLLGLATAQISLSWPHT